MTTNRWSQESIVAAIKAWSELYGGDPPTIRELDRDPSLPNSSVVKYYFDKPSDAIRAAGLRPRGRGCPGHLVPTPRKNGKLYRAATT